MASSADAVTAVEQRCLHIVALAEQQARAVQAKLAAENESLRHQLHEQDEELHTHFEQVEASLRLHIHNLKSITNEFLFAHRETTQALQSVTVSRSELESRLLAHFKETAQSNTVAAARDKQRASRRTVAAIVHHFTNPAKQMLGVLATSSDLHDMQRACRNIYGAIGASSYGPEHDIDDEENATVEVGMNVLLESPMGRSVAAMVHPLWVAGQALSPSLRECSSAVLDAVVLYLTGSADILDRFGDLVQSHIVRFLDALKANRKQILIKEERELLRLHAHRIIGVDHVQVSELPVAEVLLRRVVACAEERMARVTQLVREYSQTALAATEDGLVVMRQQLLQSLVPLVLDGLFMTEAAFREKTLPGAAAKLVPPAVGYLATLPPAAVPCPCDDSGAAADARIAVGATDSPLSGVLRDEQQLTAAPPVVVAALYGLIHESSTLADRVLIHSSEAQHAALRRVQTELTLQLDAVQRNAQVVRHVTVEQRITQMRLEDLRSDLHHQQVMRSLFLEREKSLQARGQREIHDVKRDVEHLKAIIERQAKDNATLRESLARAEAEVTLLRELTGKREETTSVVHKVKEETRTVNYLVNHGTFGETWQESLLRLRERVLREISADNARFLAKLTSFLKRKEVDHAQIETLYNARLEATVQGLGEEHSLRVKAVEARCQAMIARAQDEATRLVQNTVADCEAEKDRSRRDFEAEYLRRVDELNCLFNDRTRKLRQRESEIEDSCSAAIKRIRQDYRRREIELEAKMSMKYTEMMQIFDEDSTRVKEGYAARQQELEHAHLQAEAMLESKVNERVQVMQSQFEALSNQLQQDVLKFVGEKQAFFEQFRSEELQMFSEHVQKKDLIASERYEAMLAVHRSSSEQNLLLLQQETARTLADQQRSHEEELQKRTEELDARLRQKTVEQEQAFKVVYELHEQKNTNFWQECHSRILESEKGLMDRRAHIEVALLQRYQNLVDQCQRFLQRDIQAAREAFDEEQRMRYSHLHAKCGPMLSIALRSEHLGWEELQKRTLIVHTFLLHFDFLCVTCEEGRLAILRRQYASEVSGPDGDAFTQVVSVEDLRNLREAFDRRLAEEHAYVAHLSRDTIASLEVSLEASHQSISSWNEMHRQQLGDAVGLIQEKLGALESQRLKLTSDMIKQAVEPLMASQASGPVASAPQSASLLDGYSAAVAQRMALSAAIEQQTQHWEARAEHQELTTQKRYRASLQAMHEEYVAVAGALMSKLERSEMDNAELRRHHAQLETLLDAQSLEIRRALAALRDDAHETTAHLQLRTAKDHMVGPLVREALECREKLFVVDSAAAVAVS